MSWRPEPVKFIPFLYLLPPSQNLEGLGRLVCVGDMQFDRGVREVIARNSDSILFEAVKPHLKGDVVVGNLECPLSHRGTPVRTTNTIFRGDPEIAPSLRDGGFSLINLANNHILDYGEIAAQDSWEALKAAGLEPLGLKLNGTGQDTLPFVIRETAQGVISFLAYTNFWMAESPKRLTVSQWDPSRAEQEISWALDQSDFCVVFFHFGDELVPYPPPEARSMAQAAINMGAALVVGHHPHVLGGIEIYQGKPIAYSLGDFVFDSDHPQRRQTLIMRCYFDRTGVKGIDYLPVTLNECIPMPAQAQEREEIQKRLESISAELSSGGYPDLYYRYASGAFVRGEREALRRAFRQREFVFLGKRLLHLKPKHVRLVWHYLRGCWQSGGI
jgi:poly-gamma-glutamate synthesis protein (capsule biosynthesis protein)